MRVKPAPRDERRGAPAAPGAAKTQTEGAAAAALDGGIRVDGAADAQECAHVRVRAEVRLRVVVVDLDALVHVPSQPAHRRGHLALRRLFGHALAGKRNTPAVGVGGGACA